MDNLQRFISILLLLMIQWMVSCRAEVVFTLLSSSSTISVTWVGDPTSTYSAYSILLDGVVMETNNGNRLQADGIFVIDQLETESTYNIYINGTDGLGAPVEILPTFVKATSPYSVVISSLIEGAVYPTTLVLNWSPALGSSPTSYDLAHQDLDTAGAESITVLGIGTQMPYVLSDLLPGHNYTIDVYAVKNSERSIPTRLYANTAPAQPVIFSLVALDTTTLYMEWASGPNSIQDYFEVTFNKVGQGTSYTVTGCGSMECSFRADTTVDPSFIPGSTFQVFITAHRGMWKSAAAQQQATTKPLGNIQVEVASRYQTSLLLHWDSLSGTSVQSYSVTITPPDGSTFGPLLENNVWEYSANDLVSGRLYTFNVSAVSNGVFSEPTIARIYTFPPNPQAPTQLEVQEFWLTVTWNAPLTGEYENYIVIIERTDDGSTPPNSGSPVMVSSSASKTATFTNLVPGAMYTISVCTIVGADVQSNYISANMVTLPLPPENLHVGARTDTSLLAQWDPPDSSPVNEVQSFWAQIQGMESTQRTLALGSTLEITFNNLEPGTQYTVEIASVSNGQDSEIVTASFYTNPKEPISLRTTGVTTGSVMVEWSQPMGNTNYDGYIITLLDGTTVVTTQDLGVASISYTFNDLVAATTYTVQLVSTMADVSSRVISIQSTTQPNPPHSLTVSDPTTSTVSASWSAPVQTVSITMFNVTITQSGSSSSFASTQVTSTSYTQTGLRPGAVYTISVESVYLSVTSSPITTMVTMYPNPPSNLQITYVGQMSAQIQWNPPYNSEYAGFRIWAVAESGGATVFETMAGRDVVQQEVSSLAPGQGYTIYMSAVSASIESQILSEALTTLPTSVASMVVMDTSSTSITVSWSEPTGTDLTLYELQIYPNDGNIELPVEVLKDEELQYTFGGLYPGILYNISINAASGNSRSDSISRQISTEPSSVTNLQTTDVKTTTITINWSVDPSSQQTHFQVSYRPESSGSTMSVQVQFSQGVFSYTQTLTGLSSGQTYMISVNAVSNNVLGEMVSITQITDPEAPINLEALATSSTTATLSWEMPTNSFQDYFQYRYKGLLLPENALYTELVPTTATSVTFTDLSPGEQYLFEVYVVSGDRTSETASTIETMFPLPPSNLTVDTSQTTTSRIQIVWFVNPESYTEQWLIRYTPYATPDWEEVSMPYEAGQTSMTKTLTGLTSGQNYTVRVYGVTTNDLQSLTAQEVLATVKPSITTVLTENVLLTTENKISVNYTQNMGVFDGYLFSVDEEGVEDIFKRKDDEVRTVNFLNLQAGHVYSISVIITSGAERSSDRTLQVTTRPNAPTLEANQEATRITLYIIQPSGGVDKYRVSCSSTTHDCMPDSTTIPVSEPDPDNPLSVVYEDLVPYTYYNFEVQSIKGDKESNVVYKSATTEEAPPGEVQNFVVAAIFPSEVTLSWEQPLEQNGNITGYHLTYWRFDSTGAVAESYGGPDVLGPDVGSKTYTNLMASYNYTFQIRATTIPGPGPPTNLTRLMPIGAPFVAITGPNAIPITDNQIVSHDSFSVGLIDVFSNDNGPIKYYTVIIATRPVDVGSGGLKTWAEVQGESDQLYQAIPLCENFNDLNSCSQGSKRKKRALGGISDFVAGSEVCDPDALGEYCNGALTPESSYYIKIRAYTSTGMYADGPWSAVIHTAAYFEVMTGVGTSAPTTPVVVTTTVATTTTTTPTTTTTTTTSTTTSSSSTSSSTSTQLNTGPTPSGGGGEAPSNTLSIIIAVVVTIVVLLLIAILAVYLVRRGVCSPPVDAEMPKVAMRSNLSRRNTSGETSRPVKVADFVEHCREMAADTEFKYSEEFEDLKHIGRDQPTIASELPVNRNKNRFTNILPYDHSRVKLLPTDDEDGSDYINANYMPGFNSKREFIVTQGPLPSTRDDFWRMVWEQNCRAIVMLTKCVEKGREKCDHYWPVDSEPMYYGDLQVLILNETKCPEWIVTEFKISKGETSRKVAHFHYTAWPDFGVPEKPQSLVRFVRLVRSKLQPHGGPVVVHCSAGVGRSGAYIALDRVLQGLLNNVDVINVFGLVYEMRNFRAHMVQTEQQYICIHNCLLCVLEGNEDDAIQNFAGEDNDAFEEDEGITVDVS